MRKRDEVEAARISTALRCYEKEVRVLPGVASDARRSTFVEQIIESGRRTRYIERLLAMDINESRKHPKSGKFDPLKAAILHMRSGDIEEACWLVFLSIHFGKHRRGGWRYASDVYGTNGEAGVWNWNRIAHCVEEFRDWLDVSATLIRSSEKPGGFGNHRKYESLAGRTTNGTGAVVASYVRWVCQAGSHDANFKTAYKLSNGDSTVAFDELYRAMASVRRFGRTARFDYLSMISKLGIADIRPGKPYLAGSTGPLCGARLLYGFTPPNSQGALDLEEKLVELEAYLAIGFDPLEDALCNWQKSPADFKPFRG